MKKKWWIAIELRERCVNNPSLREAMGEAIKYYNEKPDDFWYINTYSKKKVYVNGYGFSAGRFGHCYMLVNWGI